MRVWYLVTSSLQNNMLDQQNWAVSNADTKKTIEAVAKDYIDAGINQL